MFLGMYSSEYLEETLPESLASMVSFLLQRNREMRGQLKDAKKEAESLRIRLGAVWDTDTENNVFRRQRNELLQLLEEIYEVRQLAFPIEKIREKIGVTMSAKKKNAKKKGTKK